MVKAIFFQNLLKPTTLQNYFFIHIPIQQLSTYYKIKVAVPLFSEILQNKWPDVTDPSRPAGPLDPRERLPQALGLLATLAIH